MESKRRRRPVSDSSAASFSEFFAAHERGLLVFCWGLTTDREVARDVAQEAMARAWRDWDRISAGTPVAWTRTVALNLVRNRWRSTQRGSAAALRLRGLTAESTSVHEPPMCDTVRAALGALPERQREAVVLHHLLDLPVVEVAALMGISEPAAKTHLQRGRASLAGLLADPISDDDVQPPVSAANPGGVRRV